MTINKTACFSGHRQPHLPIGKALQNLEECLYAEIEKAGFDGFNAFLCGMCYGFDFLAARQVLLHKKIKHIQLIAIVPFEGQADKWSKPLRNEYNSIIAKCDEIITLHKNYCREYYFERNRYMVERSSRLICYYNGRQGGTGYTVCYAKSKGLETINLYKSP